MAGRFIDTAAPERSEGAPTGTIESCDLGHCEDCVHSDCSLSACDAEWSACGPGSACAEHAECHGYCYGNWDCHAECDEQHPSGVDPYYALCTCVYCSPDTCSEDCESYYLAEYFCK